MKKYGINGQLRNKLFLIVIHQFSLVKAAMNDPRICKLRNGINKTPKFHLFLTVNAEQRLLRPYQCRRSGVFEA
jgi:hypothetical protein